MNKNLRLIGKKNFFWDFDGVIKDSVEIKSNAYEELFLQWGPDVSNKVRDHHILNGGMSRFDKIPLYLSWTDENINDELISKLCNKFSDLVKLKVINSPWVPGVVEYIKNLHKTGICSYIITATPQDEIIEILNELNIHSFFKEIVGAPTKKSDAIKSILDKYKIHINEAVMIGDSKSDFVAAKNNKIDFILRRTNENIELQNNTDTIKIDNFS